jgi:phosphonopyruvate decarboxylase
MLDIKEFGDLLKDKNYSFFSGVPCSLLKDIINYSCNNFQYIIATNEGEAVAISAGAHLGGKKACVLMQNSGFTNALNPLTSLNYCFKIPVLGFVSWRGEPGIKDEPEHALMGEILPSLLDICRISYTTLSSDIGKVKEQLTLADEYYKNNESYFFILKKNTFSNEPLRNQIKIQDYKREIIESTSGMAKHTRLEILEKITRQKDNETILLASTGKCGRELFEIEDTLHNLYMIGSMGCVSSIGLGIALTRPKKRIIAIDGDGALLMRMGSLATNGYYRTKNLLHILLDNNSHDSTGGQQTVSENVQFMKIASEAGYERSIAANDVKTIDAIIEKWKESPALTFIHAKIKKGSKKNLGRPTVSPVHVKERIMKFIMSSQS